MLIKTNKDLYEALENIQNEGTLRFVPGSYIWPLNKKEYIFYQFKGSLDRISKLTVASIINQKIVFTTNTGLDIIWIESLNGPNKDEVRMFHSMGTQLLQPFSHPIIPNDQFAVLKHTIIFDTIPFLPNESIKLTVSAREYGELWISRNNSPMLANLKIG